MFPLKMTPSDRLRKARRAAGFSGPTDAARRFNWKLETYKKHESGGRGITVRMASKYARAFRVAAAWLLYGEGRAPEPSQAQNEDPFDQDILTRAIAVSRRVLGPYPEASAIEPHMVSAIYALLLREAATQSITVEDEETLRVLEVFARGVLGPR